MVQSTNYFYKRFKAVKELFKILRNNVMKHPLVWLFSITFVSGVVGLNRFIYQFNSFNETGSDDAHILVNKLNDSLHMNLLSIAFIFNILFIIVACFKLYKWFKKSQRY